MGRYRVVLEVLVHAKSEFDAINIIENAVAANTEAELEDSSAELEDEDDEYRSDSEDRL
jgi:hypothetical protein